MGKELKLEHFLKVEKKYNLYQDTIDGIHYWTYARYDMWAGILDEQLGLGKAHVGKIRWNNRIPIYFKLIQNSIFKRKYSKKFTDICFAFDSSNRRMINKQYACIYTDGVEKEFSNSVVLEYPYLLEHPACEGSANLVYLDYILLKQEISYRLYPILFKNKYNQIRKAVRKKTTGPFAALEKLSQQKLDINKLEKEIIKQIIYYKAGIKSFKKLITKIHPKMMIEIAAYSSYCMMINEICKEKHIPVVELQHGVMNDHLAYSYATDKMLRQLPDKIFLFSEFWKRKIQMPMKEECLIATGFPYFESRLKQAKKIPKYNYGKRNILFLSQGTIGIKLKDLAIELAQKLGKNDYRILYKLHAGEIERYKIEYQEMENYGIEVIHTNNDILYDLFASSEIQVGVYTTAIYEGLGFGLSTFIYKIEQSEYMDDLCNLGYARFFENCEQVYRLILEKKEEKRSCEEFWKKSSLQNMKREINHILES